MLAALFVSALAGAAPEIVVEAGLEPTGAVRAAALVAWDELLRAYTTATSSEPPERAGAIRILRAPSSRPAESGTSRLGLVSLRQAREGVLDDSLLLALRHEMAHQFLLAVCPAATEDRLFHEAFAVATSGELRLWAQGDYLSTPEAERRLRRARSLDAPSSRRAVARLLAEGMAEPAGLPVALGRRLLRCASGVRWSEPLTVAELALPAGGTGASALVVLSRHSGELLLGEGGVNVPMPFGSTLKPFVLAAAAGVPELPPDSRRAEWLCGRELPAVMDGPMALLRSCNGFFLDWGERDAAAARLGALGPVLVALGLGRLPADMSEAIGVRPTLSLSPWALAQAYRVLAAARPQLLAVMRDNATRGTLAGLAVSKELSRWSTKTGTVRDPRSRPWLGWIVAVDDDLVVVKAVRDRTPRTFAGAMAEDLGRARALVATQAVDVQTFGLLPPWDVEARCPGVAVTVGTGVELTQGAFLPLVQRLEAGEAMCLGAPWLVRFPDLPDREGRAYAGVFRLWPAPPADRVPGGEVTLKERRARRGSDLVFRTTVGRYTAGVLAAEDASIEGEARIALGRVIAHNAAQARHNERPLCDTTHCQTFLSTRPPAAGDERIFAGLPLPFAGWLPFARGGREPWREERSRAEVEALLGARPAGITFERGRVHYRRTVVGAGELYDEAAQLPCELLRAPLRLPSCPEAVRVHGDRFELSGRGAGHGEGLEVEWAKRCGLDAEAILRRAYAPER